LQDTYRESSKEEFVSPKLGEDLEELEEAREEEEEGEVEGNPKPLKKKPVPTITIKKNKENRISSEFDKMLDIKWNHSVI
jgi:hypothetical protein